MKNKRIISAVLLIAVVLGSISALSLGSSAAAPKMLIFDDWTYINEFDAANLAAAGITKDSGTGTETLSDGKFTISTNKNAETVYSVKDPKIAKNDGYVIETKLSMTSSQNKGHVSFFCFAGNGWRIHSQISVSKIKIQNPSGASSTWTEFPYNFANGKENVVRYQVTIENGAANCDVFINEEYATSCLLNNNNSTALVKYISHAEADGNNFSADIEYLKYRVLDGSETVEGGNVKDSVKYPRKVKDWNYEEHFDGKTIADLEADGWTFGSNGTSADGKATVRFGQLVVTNNGNASDPSKTEYNFRNASKNLPAKTNSGAVITEIRFTATPNDGNNMFGPISYLGNGTRVFTQFNKSVSRIRLPDADGAKLQNFDIASLIDGQMHTIRFEQEYDVNNLTASGSFARVYIDRNYVGKYALHANGQKTAMLDFITQNNTPGTPFTVSIDYVKVKATSSLDNLSPDTSDGLISKVIVYSAIIGVCSLAAIEISKKKISDEVKS